MIFGASRTEDQAFTFVEVACLVSRSPKTRQFELYANLRRRLNMIPPTTKNKLMKTMLVESSPVTGNESIVVVATGAVVGGVGVAADDVGAMGVPVKAFEAGESPSSLTALIVTE